MLLIVTDRARTGYEWASGKNLPTSMYRVITRYEDILGFSDCRITYVGQPYLNDDFGKILDYAESHNLQAIKYDYGTDYQDGSSNNP